MKKTIISLAAVAAITTGAFAADKGIDIVTTGQAVIYYQTADTDGATDSSLFNQDQSSANVGIQLNLDADLKNNFTFGSQLTYVGTAGLENNLVSGTRTSIAQSTSNDLTTQIMLTKIFVAKKVANTTVKIGRQELPKSLSPLAFSEGWNVFKNTFDAILAVNTDLPSTTLVGAYVSDSNTPGTLNSTTDLANNGVNKGAYMITAQTTLIPMTTFTASYYHLSDVGGVDAVNGSIKYFDNNKNGTYDAGDDIYDATPTVKAVAGNSANIVWLDAKIAPKDAPIGLKAGVQYGNLDLDGTDTKTTNAYGIKFGAKPISALTLCAAYTDVDDGSLGVKNTGGVKTPLYTQMIANQDAIQKDATTYMAKASYSLGDMGAVTAQYADTDAGSTNVNGDNNDYAELDLVYTAKYAGVNYLAAYVRQDFTADNSDTDIIRFWARYNF